MIKFPRWFLWTLATMISWGLWAVLSRVLGDRISPTHCQALSTLGVIPIIAWLIGVRLLAPPQENQVRPSREVHSHAAIPNCPPRVRGTLWALASGVVSGFGNILFFHLLAGGSRAATAIAITSLSPLITTLLAVPLLKERLNPIQWIGVVVSLVAFVFFNFQPESKAVISPWLIWALLPLTLWGIAGLLQKMATQLISGSQAARWYLMASLPIALGILLLDPLQSPIDGETWLIALAMGFCLGLGNVTILLAFASHGKASIIAPMAGLYPLISIPIMILVYHDALRPFDSCGIVAASVAVIALSRESAN